MLDRSSHQPQSAPDAENVLFVRPIDESDIERASPKPESDLTTGEGGPDSEGEDCVPPPAPAMEEIRAGIEATLYAAGEPISIRELKKVFSDVDPESIKKSIVELLDIYNAEGRGLQIAQVAGGYQITTRPEYHDRVSSLFKFKPPSRLTIQALETLSTIAYRQPVTIPEILELRGVNSAGVVRTLLEKKLIRILGRKNVVGRPLLYGTTKEFLVRFGLKDLDELPRLEDMAEVFGEEIALQLEDTFGEGSTSATATAGSNGGSTEGSESSDTVSPATNPESTAESETSRPHKGEGAKGNGEEIEEPE
jgi:segregation and condensation protein B